MDWLERTESLLEQLEGVRLVAYPDPASGGDPWTIGVGATGPGIHRGTVWTLDQARADLRRRVLELRAQLDRVIHVALTDSQWVAILSLAYNIGLSNFTGSTLLRLLNAGDFRGAADQFLRWNRANGRRMRGLDKRRALERGIFTGEG